MSKWRSQFVLTTYILYSLLGELTDVGRDSTLKFGTALHDIYVKKLVPGRTRHMMPPTDKPVDLGSCQILSIRALALHTLGI